MMMTMPDRCAGCLQGLDIVIGLHCSMTAGCRLIKTIVLMVKDPKA